jgi:hypothetical protein
LLTKEDIDDPNVPEKEVDFLKNIPLEWKTVKSQNGHQAVVECRIKCLSSQYATFFRIKLSITDPKTKQMAHVVSHPIKVVSKVAQVRRQIEKMAQKDQGIDRLKKVVKRRRKSKKEEEILSEESEDEQSNASPSLGTPTLTT